MRLRPLLCLTAAAASLAGAVRAQTAAPLTVKDGNGSPQALGEYKPDATNLAGWSVGWVWNGSAWGLPPADSGFRPWVNIYSLPSVSLTGALPGFASTPAFTISGALPAFASTPAFTISGALPAFAATPAVKPQDSGGGDATDPANHALRVNAPLAYNLLNPSVSYPLAVNAGGTAYAAGQLMCSSTSAATCSSGLPSFSLPLGGGRITGYHLRISDATATAWSANAQIEIKEWSAQPVLAAGDRAAYALTSGTANWVGDFLCTLNGEEGDGATGYCTPVGPTPELKGVSNVYVALIAYSASGVTSTGAVTVTLTPTIEQ